MQIDRLEVSLKKYDEILKKYHSTPISISEGKLRELEESNKEKDSVIEDLKSKVYLYLYHIFSEENAQLMRTTDELLSRNSELSRKLDKNTADLEKFKRAYLALQLNINSNSLNILFNASSSYFRSTNVFPTTSSIESNCQKSLLPEHESWSLYASTSRM